ncbi:sigma-E factor negative regulatory protein [Pararobbsia alpina]|nr:sigma-E factor negative regulatory protein [Pararobbsia alpina]
MGSVSTHTQAAARAERVSAIIDSQSVPEVDQFIFELDAQDRATWATYHLVGDVLRSDDLAEHASDDAGFMSRFSARLADEPHLLAPAPHAHWFAAPATGGSSPSMAGDADPSVVAASAGLRRRVVPAFAVAAAAAILSWVVLPQLQHLGNPGMIGISPAALSAAGVPATDVRQVAMAAAPAAPISAQVNVIRDAALDQYLEAHMQFASHPGDTGSPYVRSALYSAGAN